MWTAPQLDRTEPPTIADERRMLETWLDYHRETLLQKCAGLTGEQLCIRAAEPSTMSLLGLVRHMAEVERAWFRRGVIGEDIGLIYCRPGEADDGDFDETDPANAEEDFTTFLNEVDLARKAASAKGLDDTFVRARTQEDFSLRWVYVHMIEEYARHNGHADLLRERIDGATGD